MAPVMLTSVISLSRFRGFAVSRLPGLAVNTPTFLHLAISKLLVDPK